jgi:putative acetyltransferase
MHITLESPNQPAVIQLIAELDAYQDTLYPPESRHSLDLTSLCQPNVLFAVARDTDGRAIGCGAVVLGKDYGELKRMYVHPSSRGRGVAQGVLARLESEAARRACTLIMLETGPSSFDALAFYEASGYRRRALFGSYADDPLSVFMEKPIAGPHA